MAQAARIAAAIIGFAMLAGIAPSLQAQDAPTPEEPAAAATPSPEVAAEATPRPEAAKPKEKECRPGFGCVTDLPLPRFVSLKTDEGNARRGPGLTHRIDWVFTRAGMPLRITAEFENWRRVEDVEGAGGWVHYSLLSGSRSVLVTQDMAEFRTSPDDRAAVSFQAEAGVIGRILECTPEWCRIAVEGGRGWARKTALWGTLPGEVIE